MGDRNRQIRKGLLRWYRKSRRELPWRLTSDPYRVWVSEVMLQQTQVNTVIPYYERFLDAFPDLHTLAEADTQKVLKAWEGLGYYARARNLHRAAGLVIERHDGRVPDLWEPFRKLPGVGDYIAAAVLSIAFGKPFAVVDGNVKRVMARLHRVGLSVNRSASMRRFREQAEDLLDSKDPGTFNQALMELGALVCGPRTPQCESCPIRSDCRAFQDGAVDQYPRREPSKPIPEHRIAVGVVCKRGKLLIARRRDEGLLGGLWEFPGGKIHPGEKPEAACLREIREEVNLDVAIEAPLARVHHAYSHFKVVLDVFLCRYVSGRVRLNGPVDFRWVTQRQLGDFPFPGANRKFIPEIIKRLS